MATNRVCLDNIEHLPRTSPEQFGQRTGSEDLQRFSHDGNRLSTGVGNAAAKNGDNGLSGFRKRLADPSNLIKGEYRRNIQLDVLLTETLDHTTGEFAAGIGHRDLDIDVAAPLRNLP